MRPTNQKEKGGIKVKYLLMLAVVVMAGCEKQSCFPCDPDYPGSTCYVESTEVVTYGEWEHGFWMRGWVCEPCGKIRQAENGGVCPFCGADKNQREAVIRDVYRSKTLRNYRMEGKEIKSQRGMGWSSNESHYEVKEVNDND